MDEPQVVLSPGYRAGTHRTTIAPGPRWRQDYGLVVTEKDGPRRDCCLPLPDRGVNVFAGLLKWARSGFQQIEVDIFPAGRRRTPFPS